MEKENLNPENQNIFMLQVKYYTQYKTNSGSCKQYWKCKKF